jgi:hypothetical protein
MEPPKPIEKKRGFQPKKNPSTRLADPEVLKAVKTPLPTNQIEPVSQSFAGIPPPIDTRQAKSRVLVSSLKNPLITPLPKLPQLQPADTGPSLPAPPRVAKRPTPLKLLTLSLQRSVLVLKHSKYLTHVFLKSLLSFKKPKKKRKRRILI